MFDFLLDVKTNAFFDMNFLSALLLLSINQYEKLLHIVFDELAMPTAVKKRNPVYFFLLLF